MEVNNQVTNSSSSLNNSTNVSLSSDLGIFVDTPIKEFKPSKEFAALFEEIKQPNLQNYYCDFDETTVDIILNDYNFQMSEIKTKLGNINYIIEIKKNNFVLQGDDGLDKLINFLKKLNKFETKNISNASYKIKILAKEEVFGLEENQITADYLFIVLLRCNKNLYSYIFLLENSNSSLNDIILILKERSIKFESDKIKKRVLSKTLNIKIDHQNLVSEVVYFNSFKTEENLSLEELYLNNYYSTKKVKLVNQDDLKNLIILLEQINCNYYDNFTYEIFEESNIISIVIRNNNLFYLFSLEN